ncbi:MAG: T9SS type A sorting domain-containing protein [Candidatus Delongbacteria bacterium]|nr:T9SS type A sorting domain-containing protein [Candidatus Delongbacteria bacterium]
MKKILFIIALLTQYSILFSGMPRSVYVCLVDFNEEHFDFSIDNDNVYFESWLKRNPTDVIDNNTYGSDYYMVYHETVDYSLIGFNIGNFNLQWAVGDTLVIKPWHSIDENGQYESNTGNIFCRILDNSTEPIWIGCPPDEVPIILGNYKVGINEQNNIPNSAYLEQNYPNPFNPITQIKFALSIASEVKLNVYNVNGQLISELVNDNKKAGIHIVNFDASNYNSGIYFYILTANGDTFTKKMILTK